MRDDARVVADDGGAERRRDVSSLLSKRLAVPRGAGLGFDPGRRLDPHCRYLYARPSVLFSVYNTSIYETKSTTK